MAIPTYVGVGTTATSASLTDLTPALPTYAEDDILILHFQSGGHAHNQIATPSGWTRLEEVGFVVGGLTSIVDTLWWKRASASETAPTIGGGVSVNIAVISSFRGCAASGSPVNVVGQGHRTTASTSFGPVPAETTTDDDCLVALFGGISDNTSVSTHANVSLASITERYDVNTTLGYDATIFMVTGTLASKGSTGEWTATVATSETNAWFVVAFTPTVASTGGATFDLIPGVFSA